MKILFKIAVCVMILAMLPGCAAKDPLKKQQATQKESQVHIDRELAGQVKKQAGTVKGVDETTAVVINGEISAGIKVSGLDRLFLKKIRSKVHQKLKGLEGERNIHVTSDKKLFEQLQKIERQISEGKVNSPADIQKRIEKINKDMQG